MKRLPGKPDTTARDVRLGFSPIGGACFVSPVIPEHNEPMTDHVSAQEKEFIEEDESETRAARRKDQSTDRSLSGQILKWITNS